MARRYDSEAVRNRVLSTSVRLFLERGYHGTTMAAILKEAECPRARSRMSSETKTE